jgi:hypothetical protein
MEVCYWTLILMPLEILQYLYSLQIKGDSQKKFRGTILLIDIVIFVDLNAVYLFFIFNINPNQKSLESLHLRTSSMVRNSKWLGNTVFRQLELFPSSGEGDTYCVGSLPSPEDGNSSSCWNVVFSSYLEFWTMDKVHKPSDVSVVHHRQ